MAVKIKISEVGLGEVLKSGAMAALIHAKAEEIAAGARGIMVEGRPGTVPLPVEITDSITDRARSSVTLAHPAGLAAQAKYGVLTKGAGGQVSG